MSEAQPNCISYVFYQRKIDKIERYRDPPTVGELMEWFRIITDPSYATALAVVWGSKLDTVEQKQSHRVKHMISVDSDLAFCSHRQSEGANVDYDNADSLLDDYINEQGLYYRILLQLRTR